VPCIIRITRYIYTYTATLHVPANAAVQGLFARGPGRSLTRYRLRAYHPAPLPIMHTRSTRSRTRVCVHVCLCCMKKFHAPQRFRLSDEPLRTVYHTAPQLCPSWRVNVLRFHFVTSSRTGRQGTYVRIAIIYMSALV